MSQFKHLIFDLDGTLVDSRKGIISSLFYTAGEMNFRAGANLTVNEIRILRGEGQNGPGKPGQA